MKLNAVVNAEDMRALARSALPRIAFDFIDGGVADEEGLTENRAAFRRHKLVPRYLVDVSRRDQTVEIFGSRYASPIGISPMGIAGFFRPGADLMLARAAAEANIPYIMSSASCDSIERAMAVAPDTTWFQIYGTRDPAIVEDLVRRATALRVKVLVLTIDTPIIGGRERNIRNGFTRPMKLTPGIVLQGLLRPRWTLGFLKSGGVPVMENWKPYSARKDANSVADLYGAQTPAPGQTWEVLHLVRRLWNGPLLVKGVLHPEDALLCAEAGADGLIVSNHGGRQLDKAPAPLDVLRDIRARVGDRLELIVDGGVRRGSDVVVALSLGARMCTFGRPAMFSVAGAGQAGAAKLLKLMRSEIDMTLAQIGCTSLDDLGAHRLASAARDGQPDLP
ncbi:alpha-hydroxy-acid oxidizing protein [Roseococcus sp. SYP-B2431]|uniref:alpha-hydroxy acid oxidase n=1 Tax=Roseococcus sp. SYP-B2431 TaxID=2496640 RepID=UPI00103EA21C|nr:alpha-hydroxy acid oxidase [Roseococcus sp. SYP-B2431]TCH97030.1 alpha-hydroxy-acid oxidizing protein [Roseococcus sp. SYP-B2431]